jgi:hypothetical protein
MILTDMGDEEDKEAVERRVGSRRRVRRWWARWFVWEWGV